MNVLGRETNAAMHADIVYSLTSITAVRRTHPEAPLGERGERGEFDVPEWVLEHINEFLARIGIYPFGRKTTSTKKRSWRRWRQAFRSHLNGWRLPLLVVLRSMLGVGGPGNGIVTLPRWKMEESMRLRTRLPRGEEVTVAISRWLVKGIIEVVGTILCSFFYDR